MMCSRCKDTGKKFVIRWKWVGRRRIPFLDVDYCDCSIGSLSRAALTELVGLTPPCV